MPSAWTHILFGKEVFSNSDISTLDNVNLYNLGCQGPDFLYYHKFWSTILGRKTTKLANLYHTKRCGEVITDLIIQTKNKPNLQEYVLGFITHYILDTTTHPYINYKSGYKKYKHNELEAILDTLVAHELEGIETWNTPVSPIIDVGETMPSSLIELLVYITDKYYPELGDQISFETYHQSYKNMKTALDLFCDPSGWKNILTLGRINKFKYKPDLPKKDFLNEQRIPWHHPAIFNEVHSESFWDLWEESKTKGINLINNSRKFWDGEITKEDLVGLTGNLCYMTGKDCDMDIRNKYAEPLV